MKLIKISLAILLTANASVVIAQTSALAVPNIFTSGERAVAADVNENFQELANRIQVSSSVYDYKDYSIANNVTQKVFDIERAGVLPICFSNQQTRTYTNTEVTGGTEITERRVTEDTNDGTVCSVFEETRLATDTEVSRTKRTFFNVDDGVTVTSERNYTNAIQRTADMRIGQKILNLVRIERNDFVPLSSSSSVTSFQREIISVEDVTVPAGTYSACTKTEYKWGSNVGHGIAWYCPNLGLVKTAFVGDQGSTTLYELSSVTTAP